MIARMAFTTFVYAGLFTILVSCSSSSGPIEEQEDNSTIKEPAVGFIDGLEFATSNPGLEIEVSDIDNDGSLDLYVRMLGNGFKILGNTSIQGQISFNKDIPVFCDDEHVLNIQCNDVNDDGLQDLLLLDNNGFMNTYIQLQDFSFTHVSSIEFLNDVVYGQRFVLDCVNTSDDTLDFLMINEDDSQIRTLFTIPGTGGTNPSNGIPAGINADYYDSKPATITKLEVVEFENNGLNDVLALDERNSLIRMYTHIERPLGEYVSNPDTGDLEIPQPGVFYGYEAVKYKYSECTIPSMGNQENIVSPRPCSIDLADIDTDGISDIAVLCKYDGGLTPQVPYFMTSGFDNVVIVPTTMIWILENSIIPTVQGNGWESDNTAGRKVESSVVMGLTFPNWVNDVKLADVDNDGEIDIIGCCEGPGTPGNSFFYYPGNGDFTYDAPIGYSLAAPPLALVAEDFDNDSFVDVAVLLPSINAVSVSRNDGNSGLGEAGVQYVLTEE